MVVPMEVSGNETICVVGLGYVGLPTAISFYKAGFRVVGVDVSEQIVKSLNDGINLGTYGTFFGFSSIYLLISCEIGINFI